MNKKALHGVNLGGWLIAERWMTPGLFEGITARDEYGLAKTAEGRKRLAHHRQKFIQEEDFAWLAAHGVELLRIPFGYWLFVDDPAYEGDVERLDWAMKMAEKYKLKVLLDLHALPGSQNGKDHSGRIGKSEWFRVSEYRAQSREICRRVAARYADSPALWGFEILNEPALGVRKYFILLGYYRRAQRELADILPDSVFLLFSDAFAPWLFAGALRGRVAMDIHWYSWMIRVARRTSLEKFFKKVARRRQTIRMIQRRTHPVVIGEWGAVLPRSLKPRIGERTWRAAAVEHLKLQRTVYSEALAECYWTYKTEQPGMWSYRTIVEKNLLLSPDDATIEV